MRRLVGKIYFSPKQGFVLKFVSKEYAKMFAEEYAKTLTTRPQKPKVWFEIKIEKEGG